MKLGVWVPYRNREAHLKEFIPRVGKYLENQGIDYQIYFGHQVDDKLFNRVATKNIAAEWAFKEGVGTRLGATPQLCKNERLFDNLDPHYDETKWFL